MKHRLLWILSLCLLAAALTVGTALSVFAEKAGTVSIESLTVTAGTESVTLKITLADNPGMINLKLALEYDSEHFALETVSDGKLFKDFQTSEAVTDDPFVMVWNDDLAEENITADGTLATLTFAVLPGTPAKDYVFSLSCEDTYDKDLNAVTVTPANGTVTVTCLHEFGEWTVEKAAAIREEGLEKRVCALCGHEETRVLPPLEDTHTHTFNGSTEIIKEASCTEEGILRTYCGFDGCTVSQDTAIPKLEHVIGDWVEETPVSCASAGRRVRRCALCESVLEEEILPKLEHTPGNFVIGIIPDCTHKGTQTQSCTVCGMLLKTEELPAQGHNSTSEVTAPGCFTEGYTIKTCQTCGAVEKTDIVPAIGYHTVKNWTVVKEAANGTAGEKTGVCTVCGKAVTVITAPLTGSIAGENVAVVSRGSALLPEDLQVLLTDRSADGTGNQAAEAVKASDICQGQSIAGILELTLTTQNKTTEQEPVEPEAFRAPLTVKILKPNGLAGLENIRLLSVDAAGSVKELPLTDNGDGTVTLETDGGGWLVFTGSAPATPAPTEEITPAPTAKPKPARRDSTPTAVIVLLIALILAVALLGLVIIRRVRKR